MTRYTLTLPLKDNAGRPVDHAHLALRAELLRDFGGFTYSQTRGQWRDEDEGDIYEDESIVYIIDTDRPDHDRYMVEAAQRACTRASQVAVYLTAQKLGSAVLVGPA